MVINNNTYCLVLGGYLNAYEIIRGLKENSISNIANFDNSKDITYFSNLVSYFRTIELTSNSLLKEINKLKDRCDYIIIYPTDDLQIELLVEIYDKIASFCYIPFNKENILNCLDKRFQYQFCEKNNIPYPKSIEFDDVQQLESLKRLVFPLIMKPIKRDDVNTDVFRALIIQNYQDIEEYSSELERFISKGIKFIVSEYIPGDDTNIYAYTAFRSKNGEILNYFLGKKLNQYPNLVGVFSSATNICPEIVAKQGKELLTGLNIFGIAEPEFKYDVRDGKYKLTEINLRSMMWHRLGVLQGVNLQYIQYLDAMNISCEEGNDSCLDSTINYVFLNHEILNLIFRKSYWKYFKHNVFSKKVCFALYNKNDLKPFLYSIVILLPKMFISRCLKLLHIK